MSQGTVYVASVGRGILLKGLVKELNLDITIALEKDEAYTKNFKLNKLPAFIGPKGFKLFESIAILEYVVRLSDENSPLLGKTLEDQAKVLQWLSLSTAEFLPQIANAFKPLTGAAPYNKKQVSDAIDATNLIASIFEDRLSQFTYLVGERITLADLFAASISIRGFQHLWGAEWRAQYPNFVRWWNTIRVHPALIDSFSDFEFIAKPVEFTPPKKEKKEQPKAAPKAEKKPKAVEEDAEEQPAEEKKAKHPLELLGKPTNFNLDEWKRTYSNEETRETALPWFWEHYDPSEWSLWRVDYKYNDELTLTFMSNNLVGGFFNRLGASTKYLFGSGVVYGENNNNGIVAVFLVRGQEFAPAFDVAPDWESYEFTKLDGEKDKEFVNDVFAWDKPLVINGETREIADGKVFK